MNVIPFPPRPETLTVAIMDVNEPSKYIVKGIALLISGFTSEDSAREFIGKMVEFEEVK